MQWYFAYFTLMLLKGTSFKLSVGDQPAKKVISDSPGLVDFALGLLKSVLNVSDGQMIFFFLRNSDYRRTVINPAHQNFFRTD